MSVLIKCFETPNMKYVYDRSLDSVACVTNDEYKSLKEVEKTGKLPINNSLDRLIKNGFLKETVIHEIEHPETHNIKTLSEHYLNELVLQVTKQCNLRCKYCAYSGNYYNREHSSSRMRFETARKAIDFYLKRSDKFDKLSVAFYGGEPLLEFELIKKCVKYILENKGDKKVTFPMTTNGTLLTQEVIEFLVKYDFELMISLDGNKYSHDANRQFRNGIGSFDVILSNLEKLRKYDENYYYQKVMFNCVISSTTDLEDTYRFYSKNVLFKPEMVHFNYVSMIDIKDDNIAKLTMQNIRVDRLAYLKMLLAVLKKSAFDAQSLMMRERMSDVELLYEQLHKHSVEGEKAHHGGPCMPGIRKLFVDTDGKFYPCERVSEEDPQMNIGSIQDGFDLKAMDFMINHGKMISDECLNCWNLRRCCFCLGSIPKKNKILSKEMLLKRCKTSKAETMDCLERLCILKEFGYKGNENFNLYR